MLRDTVYRYLRCLLAGLGELPGPKNRPHMAISEG
jgi:hypothetical protein